MANQGNPQNPRQHSHDDEKAARERMERRRLLLERKSKHAAKVVVRGTETVLLKAASKGLLVAQKLNRQMRKRIKLDDE